MITVGSVKRVVLCVSMAALLVVLGSSSSALALSPWWHLTSGSRPSNLQPGLAQDEVQEIAVSATEGRFLLLARSEAALLNWNATHEEVQEGLEKIYGKGNVEVGGGPGDETGSDPYVVTFVGELADQAVAPIDASNSVFLLGCGGATGSGCKKTATLTERTRGRSDGQIVLTASNLGDANTDGEAIPVSIADELPSGLKAVTIEGQAGTVGLNNPGPVNCTLATLTCTFAGILPPFDQIEVLISVVAQGATSGEMNKMSVSGGQVPAASLRRPTVVGGRKTPYGVEDYELEPELEGGIADAQAGSHMFQLTTTLTLNQTADTNPAEPAKDLNFELPAGLIGNPTPFPQCTLAQFETRPSGAEAGYGNNECPPQTAVGVAMITVNGASVHISSGPYTFTVPVFNVEPAYGEPARFGFTVFEAPVFLDTSVRTGGDYGVTVSVHNITQTGAFLKNEVTFWGVTGDPSHDAQRGWACLAAARTPFPQPCSPTTAHHPPPLLTMPTSCSGEPLQTSVATDSWLHEGSFQSFASQPMPTLDGCNRLPFAPSIGVAPDGQAASTPTGLSVGVHVPQDPSLNATGLAEADVKDTTVTLPEGVALNPAAADGLAACSEGLVGLEDDAPASCPEASKVGTVEIDSPLLPEPLVGEAYLAAQNANPFGTLVALYVVAEDPKAGVLVKLAGEVTPDPVTGQLVSTFKDTPQLPFEDFKLHFFGGSRAPLSTPPRCGSYTTLASIAPWSGNGAVQSTSSFQILSGPNGTACAASLPFDPTLTAGSTNIQRGAFSPFTMTMSREDGQQNLKAVKLHMPPGLLGTLAGVQLCPQAQADAGTCGPNSQIGETIVSVGLGGDPFSVTGGRVYITEGYGGAPYGLSIVNQAKAGPYDLGQVVVRAKIEIDPLTAALTVTTDSSGPYAIPQIIDGIPLQIKHVNVTIDRPGFTFNPTNCSPLAITGTLSSAEGATDDLSVPFQVTNCATLGFKPSFEVSTSGKTSRADGASLHVKLTYPDAPFATQANIHSVHVELPRALPSRLTTLNHACLDSVFDQNPAACPPQSRVGFAKALTPILPVPLEGPAYFVSHGNQKFPELIVVLQGYGATVYLHGETFISKAGITSSTFRQVPDVPVGSFELTLPEREFSALAAITNLCAANLTMPTAFEAQNGATLQQNTPVQVEGCADALLIQSHEVHGHTLTLRVTVPEAGTLTTHGNGLRSSSKAAVARATLTLHIAERKPRRLRTRVQLSFTPAAGKERGKHTKELHKTLTVTFP